MPIMNWSVALDIGIDSMNREHRQILDAMNLIYDNHKTGVAGAEMMRQIETLRQVTVNHFRDEEAYMRQVSYPDLENHKRIHDRLLRDLERHVQEAEATGGVPSRNFFDFLALWLSAHIKNIDRKYAEFRPG